MTTSATPAKGLEGIVAASTRLSDVRGDVGQLIYCGYDINELAGKVTFEEVVHLLEHDHLPNREELEELRGLLAVKRDLPKGVVEIIKAFPRDTPPMPESKMPIGRRASEFIVRPVVCMRGCHRRWPSPSAAGSADR